MLCTVHYVKVIAVCIEGIPDCFDYEARVLMPTIFLDWNLKLPIHSVVYDGKTVRRHGMVNS